MCWVCVCVCPFRWVELRAPLCVLGSAIEKLKSLSSPAPTFPPPPSTSSTRFTCQLSWAQEKVKGQVSFWDFRDHLSNETWNIFC